MGFRFEFRVSIWVQRLDLGSGFRVGFDFGFKVLGLGLLDLVSGVGWVQGLGSWFGFGLGLGLEFGFGFRFWGWGWV